MGSRTADIWGEFYYRVPLFTFSYLLHCPSNFCTVDTLPTLSLVFHTTSLASPPPHPSHHSFLFLVRRRFSFHLSLSLPYRIYCIVSFTPSHYHTRAAPLASPTIPTRPAICE